MSVKVTIVLLFVLVLQTFSLIDSYQSLRRITTGITLLNKREIPSSAFSLNAATKVELVVSKPQAFVNGLSRTINQFMKSSLKSKIIVVAHMIPLALLYMLVTSKMFKDFCSKILTALTSVLQGVSKQTKSTLTESIEKAKVEASIKSQSDAEQEKIKAMDESARKLAAEKVKKLAEEEEARANAKIAAMTVKVPVEPIVVPVVTSPIVTKVEPKVVAAVVPIVDSEPVFAPWAVEAKAKAMNNNVEVPEVPVDTGRDQIVVLLATAAIVSPLLALLQQ